MGLIRNYIYITVSRVIMRNNTNDKKLAEYSVFGLVATENQKILLFPFLNVVNLLNYNVAWGKIEVCLS